SYSPFVYSYALPLFLSTLPTPLTSPLFPYTTLFRSSGSTCTSPARRRRSQFRSYPQRSPRRTPERQDRRTPSSQSWRTPVLTFGDRKSTRLNSSHVKISYAVFCLKKKKNKTKQQHNT